MTHSPTLRENDRAESPRIDATRSIRVDRSTSATQRVFHSATLELYQRELDYFRADEPFLTLEKCAERCLKLSMLLPQARMDQAADS